MEGRLLNKGVSCSFIRTAHETRTNIIVNDLSSHTQTVFSAQGTEISPHELTQLVRQVENIQSPDFVIISGSLPRGIHPEIYRKMIELND